MISFNVSPYLLMQVGMIVAILMIASIFIAFVVLLAMKMIGEQKENSPRYIEYEEVWY